MRLEEAMKNVEVDSQSSIDDLGVELAVPKIFKEYIALPSHKRDPNKLFGKI